MAQEKEEHGDLIIGRRLQRESEAKNENDGGNSSQKEHEWKLVRRTRRSEFRERQCSDGRSLKDDFLSLDIIRCDSLCKDIRSGKRGRQIWEEETEEKGDHNRRKT